MNGSRRLRRRQVHPESVTLGEIANAGVDFNPVEVVRDDLSAHLDSMAVMGKHYHGFGSNAADVGDMRPKPLFRSVGRSSIWFLASHQSLTAPHTWKDQDQPWLLRDFCI
jgi:hypothetical protein